MLTAPIGPTLLRLAAPNIVSMVMSSLTMMTEAFYVGQLGTAPLAGLALGFPMMMLMGMLSAGAFGGTITGAVSRRLGAGDRAGAEEVAVHAVLLMVVLASICAAVFLAGGRFIYGALGGYGVVLEQALAYIEDDERVEVTPKSIRLRKTHLDPNDRKRAERAKETV